MKRLESSQEGNTLYAHFVDGVNLYGSELDLCITFTLLDELRTLAPAVLNKALKKIYSTLVKIKVQLIDSDDYKFYAREETLNNHREYLVTIIEDEKVEQDTKDIAVKLIVLIGNLRASGEDYLVAYNLISKYQMTVNLNAELSQCSCFEQKSGLQDESQTRFRLNTKNSSEVVVLHQTDQPDSFINLSTMAFDEQYAYIDCLSIGMFKIGI